MRSQIRFALGLAFVAIMAGGCRFVSLESFDSATTPNPPGEWKGDKYASAGNAEQTGGTKTASHYNEGATVQTEKLDNTLDKPGKGSGQQPGEPGMAAKPGYGNSNAPALQPEPGSVGAPGANVNP